MLLQQQQQQQQNNIYVTTSSTVFQQKHYTGLLCFNKPHLTISGRTKTTVATRMTEVPQTTLPRDVTNDKSTVFQRRCFANW